MLCIIFRNKKNQYEFLLEMRDLKIIKLNKNLIVSFLLLPYYYEDKI